MHERRDAMGLAGGIHTEHIALVEPIGGDDCIVSVSSRGPREPVVEGRSDILVMRRLGWPAPSMMRGYAAHQQGAQVRKGGSWRRRSRGGSQSSRWLRGPLRGGPSWW